MFVLLWDFPRLIRILPRSPTNCKREAGNIQRKYIRARQLNADGSRAAPTRTVICVGTFVCFYGSKPYPVVGDWTVGGSDTAGLIDESNAQFFLRNAHVAGSPDEQFVFGIPADEPIAGHWSVSNGHD